MGLIRVLKNVAFRVIPSSAFRTYRMYRHEKTVKEYSTKVGTNRKCNFCEESFAIFAPFNDQADRMCPNCFSLERHRLLLHFIKTRTNILTDNVKILHFAPEKCISEIIETNKHAIYETADLMIQFLPGLEVQPKHRMSITDIKFEDDNFDFFISNHVLEHVPDDTKAINEIHRVLKRGGLALLQVPINAGAVQTLEDPTLNRIERRTQYMGQHHLRYYAAQALQTKLESVGFSVELYRYPENLDHNLYRINPAEIQFVATKQ